ncbi:MAG TPA: hypothetical protein VMM76_07865 [Pirellulaceae bacterium]|nr:hypothetical protein [Pirellulaceae bacterium]
MRAVTTITCLPKHTRQLVVILVMPLLFSVSMLNLTTTSRAEGEVEELTLPLELVHFDALFGPDGDTIELIGQIQAYDPEGLTVTFTGEINASVQTDASGAFNYIVFLGPDGISGTVTGEVSQGTETVSKTISI